MPAFPIRWALKVKLRHEVKKEIRWLIWQLLDSRNHSKKFSSLLPITFNIVSKALIEDVIECFVEVFSDRDQVRVSLEKLANIDLSEQDRLFKRVSLQS